MLQQISSKFSDLKGDFNQSKTRLSSSLTKLEKDGFDSKICLADKFANGSIAHAWVAIDIPPRRYYVEPTALNTGGFVFSTIKPYDGNYRDYSRYDAIYEDIYEATKNNPVSEFDWWNDPQLAFNLNESQRGR